MTKSSFQKFRVDNIVVCLPVIPIKKNINVLQFYCSTQMYIIVVCNMMIDESCK